MIVNPSPFLLPPKSLSQSIHQVQEHSYTSRVELKAALILELVNRWTIWALEMRLMCLVSVVLITLSSDNILVPKAMIIVKQASSLLELLSLAGMLFW